MINCSKKTRPTFLVLFLVISFLFSPSLVAKKSKNLETMSPEEAGWSSKKLEQAARYAREIGYTAMMLAYDGKVFFSWGKVKKNYRCHSLRKAFLSSLYGIYVVNKTIDTDLTIADLGIDDTPPILTDYEKKATIKQLLKSRSGIYHGAAGETIGMRKSRPKRGSHTPGAYFYYNNWDFNVLGAIFEQMTHTKIFDEFKKRIADPIGMQDFKPSKCSYKSESYSKYPKYAFRMSARDLIRFGILYQKGGLWQGQRIIPEQWFKESTTTYSIVNSSVGIGFGYMWGTILKNSLLSRLMGGTGYFFSGLSVHSLTIIPDVKLVQVLRMDTDTDWRMPGSSANSKLYTMITEARITKEKSDK